MSPRLRLPGRLPDEAHSEAELIAQFERMKRPIDDVSFRSHTDRHSFVQGLRIGGLDITEAILSPMVTKTKAEKQLAFIIPLAGKATLTEGTRSLQLHPAQLAFCLFEQPASFSVSGLQCISLRPNPATVRDILTRRVTSDTIDHIIPTSSINSTGRFDNTNYLEQIFSLINLLNSSNGDVDFLSRIGFDDVAANVFAEFLMTLKGRAHDQDPSKLAKRSMKSVEMICDFIEANIGKPMTIPQMEKLTRMTGRSINYAFQERFGMSPQQWQRDYLLDLARVEIMKPDNLKSIKRIAYDLGFSSTSSFSAHYQRKFGERPSSRFCSNSTSSTPPSEKINS